MVSFTLPGSTTGRTLRSTGSSVVVGTWVVAVVGAVVSVVGTVVGSGYPAQAHRPNTSSAASVIANTRFIGISPSDKLG